MFLRQISSVMRNVKLCQQRVLVPSVRFASYGDAPPPPTMDDLPVPSGSWETQYKANQNKYNMHLAIGLVFSAVTLIVVKTSGLIFFNASPPAVPAPRE